MGHSVLWDKDESGISDYEVRKLVEVGLPGGVSPYG